MGRYNDAHGQHTPSCGGSCLTTGSPCGNDDSFVNISFLMVACPTAIWAALVAPYLWEKWHATIVIPAAIFLFGSVYCLLAACLTEPGILPVVDAAPDTSAGGLVAVVEPCWDALGKQLELPTKRAKMVRETDNCVENFDHYCPWVSNAVGRRNYRHFVFFLTCTNLLAVFVGTTSILFLIIYVDDAQSFENAISNKPAQVIAAIAEVVYCISIMFCVGGLWWYHVGLIIKNQTTNEDLKDTYRLTENPHDLGCRKNCANFLCGKKPPSYVCGDVSVVAVNP